MTDDLVANRGAPPPSGGVTASTSTGSVAYLLIIRQIFWLAVLLSWTPILMSEGSLVGRFFALVSPPVSPIDEATLLPRLLQVEATSAAKPPDPPSRLIDGFTLDKEVQPHSASHLTAAISPPNYVAFMLLALVILLGAVRLQKEADTSGGRDDAKFLRASDLAKRSNLILLLCVGPPAIASLASVSGTWKIEYDMLYFVSVFLSLLVFAVKGRIRAFYVALFVGALLLQVYFSANTSEHFPADGVFSGTRNLVEYALPGMLFENFNLTFSDVISALALLIFLRFLTLVVDQNLPLLKILDWGDLARAATAAFFMWWPMLAVFLGAAWSYGHAWSTFEKEVVRWNVESMRSDKGDSCSATVNKPPVWPQDHDVNHEGWTLEMVERRALRHYARRTQDCYRAILEQSAAKAKVTAAQARRDAVVAVDQGLPGRLPGTEQERCKLNAVCYIKNGAKSMANSGYSRGRSNLVGAVDSSMQKLDKKVKEGADPTKDQFISSFNEGLIEAAQATDYAIKTGAENLRLAGVLFTLYSIMVLIKTYLMVLSRCLFRWRNGASEGPRLINEYFATVHGIGASPWRLQTITSHKNVYHFDRSGVFDMARRKRLALKGIEHRLSWRFPTFAPIARLLNGVYWTNAIHARKLSRLSTKGPLGKVVAGWQVLVNLVTYPARLIGRAVYGAPLPNTQQAAQASMEGEVSDYFVEWLLHKGESIYFNMDDLVAFERTISFRNEVSLRLSSLVFGRIFFKRASGPGRIILRTLGSPVLPAQPGDPKVINSECLVAWRAEESFAVASAITVVDTFFNPHSLQCQQGAVVFDGLSSGQRSTAVARFIRTFLMPF